MKAISIATRIFLTLALVASQVAFSAASQAAVNPEEILRKADRARGGVSDGLSWGIQMQNSGSSTLIKYEVKVKGNNVLARCQEPARQKGEVFLFNDRNLWVFRPGLKKPVSLSPRQRLTGQAANGDIATTNYARDYTPKLEGEEDVDGQPTYRLFLQAKESNVTYDKIRYWITKKDFLGVKAEFLTLEGAVFKTAQFSYKNSIPVNGKEMPFVSEMKIQDATKKDDTTTIEYAKPKAEKVSDSEFNVNNLVR